MNKPFSFKRFSNGILFAATFFAANIQAALITLSPAESEIPLNGTFEVNLSIAELYAEDLGGFDLALTYDPAVLEFVTFSAGVTLGEGFDAEVDFDVITPGTVDISDVSMLADLSAQPDAFSLGSVTFRGIAYGTSRIALSNVLLSNGSGYEISFTPGDPVSASVPEPHVASMLAFGLFGLIALKRRSSGQRNG